MSVNSARLDILCLSYKAAAETAHSYGVALPAVVASGKLLRIDCGAPCLPLSIVSSSYHHFVTGSLRSFIWPKVSRTEMGKLPIDAASPCFSSLSKIALSRLRPWHLKIERHYPSKEAASIMSPPNASIPEHQSSQSAMLTDGVPESTALGRSSASLKCRWHSSSLTRSPLAVSPKA